MLGSSLHLFFYLLRAVVMGRSGKGLMLTRERFSNHSRSLVQGETTAEMKAGERHHKEYCRSGEWDVQRHGGQSEYSLEHN